MTFDFMVLSAVTQELRNELIGAKINKIHQPDTHTLVLRYHGQFGSGRLLLSMHPQNGRIHRTETTRENPAKAPLFVMVLRKWLEGGRITGIEATDGERIATLYINSYDELGDTVSLRLIIEIMGKHSNIILVHPDGHIIDGARRYGSTLSRWREVLPGRPYRTPPPINKLPLPPANVEELAKVMYDSSELTVSHALQRKIAGLSPLLAEHITLAAGLDPQQSSDQLGLADFDNLLHELQLLRRMIENNAFIPTLLVQNGTYCDFSAIVPLQWPDDHILRCDSMSKAIELLYSQREAEQQLTSHRQLLRKQLRRHINRIEKKIALEEGDLAQCEAAEQYRTAGDLLASNLWRLERGMSEVKLESFDEPGKEITVWLDPALSPQENIQRYYRRYTKAKKARGLIENQLMLNRAELDYALSIDQSVADSESSESLMEPEREAIAAGYVRPPVTVRQTKQSKNSTQLPPRRYISSDGFTVLIGRNNKQNDRLSLHQAAENDIWLHTQKIPGSHVIIVSEGREIPERTLLEAATWAAWFSKAKDSSNVPVDYLPAGRLKKPPAAHAGYVIYTGQKTLFVNPKKPDK